MMWYSFWRSHDPFSLDEFKYLYDQLQEYQTVNESDRDFVVEILRSIAEIVTYGDQHDPSIFEFFMDKQVMAQFLHILKISGNSGVAIQLLQTLSIMIQNLRSEHAIYYLFSNEYINNLITYPFEFHNEELVPYYISFLRTISGKLDNNTISLLVKTQNDAVVSFPLYSEAIKFAHHEENMVRIAVRSVTLNIYRVSDESLYKFIVSPPMSGYFSDLVKFLRQQCFKLDALVVGAAKVHDYSLVTEKLVSTIEEIGDDLYYFSDVICTSVPDLSKLMTQNLLRLLVMPVLLPSLHSSQATGMQMSALTSLYLLSRIIQVVNNKDLVNNIAAAFLNAPTAFSIIADVDCNGHSFVGGLSSESTNSVQESAALVNVRTGTQKQVNHNNVIGPLGRQFTNIALLEESDKDKKQSSRDVLVSLVFCENYKLLLASLSLLVVLFQSKEVDDSFLDALRIVPQKMQHKTPLLGEDNLSGLSNKKGISPGLLMDEVCKILDALTRLFCCSPPLHAEVLWHAGWLLQKLLPYHEKKLSHDHFNVAYEKAYDDLLKEVKDCWCDLLPEVLLNEWKGCKKAIEIPAYQKELKFVLMPDSQLLIPDGEYSSLLLGERMRVAVKVFVVLHQLTDIIVRGTLPEYPQLALMKELPVSSRARSSGLDAETIEVGVELNLCDAIPCRIAFEEGKERHVYMLAIVMGRYGWLLLSQEVLAKPHRGVVFAIAPLAGTKPKIDENHPRWLHLQIRSPAFPSIETQTVGNSTDRYRTNQSIDGRWTLAFSDDQTCKFAKSVILEEMATQSSFVKHMLEPLLVYGMATSNKKKSLSDMRDTNDKFVE
eukprot:Gb_04682 [translate_table: standard]